MRVSIKQDLTVHCIVGVAAVLSQYSSLQSCSVGVISVHFSFFNVLLCLYMYFTLMQTITSAL